MLLPSLPSWLVASGPLLTHDDPGASLLSSPLTMIPIVAAIFYFVLWRPQQQEQKEQQKLIASLQRGDKVVTTGGIHGTVHEAKADTLVIEVSTNSFLTVDRDTVKRKVAPPAAEAPAKSGK